MIINCTECEISNLSSQCLRTILNSLGRKQKSRDEVTTALVDLWKHCHKVFFEEYEIKSEALQNKVYELSVTWIRQKLQETKYTNGKNKTEFTANVTIGKRSKTEQNDLPNTLLTTMVTAVVNKNRGWDTAMLASSELLAVVMNDLYIVSCDAYPQNLWPYVAFLINSDRQKSSG